MPVTFSSAGVTSGNNSGNNASKDTGSSRTSAGVAGGGPALSLGTTGAGGTNPTASRPWDRFRSAESFANFKQGMTHVGLFALFITYTVIGGKIFQVLEHSKEIERHAFMMEDVQYSRKRILALLVRHQNRSSSSFSTLPSSSSSSSSSLTSSGSSASPHQNPHQQFHHSSGNNRTRSESGSPAGFPRDGAADDNTDSYDDPSTAGKGSHTPRGYFLALDDGFDGQAQAGDPSVPSWHSLAAQAEAELSVYEMKLAQAFELDISPWDEEPRYHWNFVQSVFFASTVITSIGYGNIAPKTTEGRVFCIIFALIGIPLTLTALTDLGRMLATSAASLYKRIRARFAWVRRVTIGHGTEAGTSIATKSLYVLAGLSMLTLYIAFGGMLFMLLERWSFFESFYFCFITMTTIGLGDLVPGNTTYTLFCTLYIFLGLALTSTTIELVRRQYAESWERMKMLSGRLAELSGPLSDTLKRLGEQAHRRGGDMTNVDMSLLKELRELRKAVAITKMEMETGCALSDQSFSDNFDFDPPPPPPPRPKVVWIIYETNV